MRRAYVRFSLLGTMIAVGLTALALASLAPRGAPLPVSATSSDPRVATGQEKVVHGMLWGMSYEQAREQAKREDRPILIYFSSVFDANSRAMELNVLPRPDVVPLLADFTRVQLPIDVVPIRSLTPAQQEQIAEENQEHELDFHEFSSPVFVALDSEGKVITSLGGVRTPAEFVAFLNLVQTTPRGRPGWTLQFQAVKKLLAASLIAVGIGMLLRSRQRRARGDRVEHVGWWAWR